MPNQNLLSLLAAYQPLNATDGEMAERMRQFVLAHENCMDRNLTVGHITGSAWILDKQTKQKALFTHHLKLNKWLQLGGHAEGETEVLAVALREAQEESGLPDFEVLSEAIFSLDIHTIPERKGFPEHLHYDICFLFTTDADVALNVSEESHGLGWIALGQVHQFNDAPSIMRMVERSQTLFPS